MGQQRIRHKRGHYGGQLGTPWGKRGHYGATEDSGASAAKLGTPAPLPTRGDTMGGSRGLLHLRRLRGNFGASATKEGAKGTSAPPPTKRGHNGGQQETPAPPLPRGDSVQSLIALAIILVRHSRFTRAVPFALPLLFLQKYNRCTPPFSMKQEDPGANISQ